MNKYEKAVKIYEEGGQAAIYDAVKNGILSCKGWGYCSGCEDETPHDESRECLVCGLEVFGEVYWMEDYK